MTSQGPAIATEPISDVSDVSDGASRSVPRRTAAGARIPSVADRLSSAVGHVAMVCAPAGYGKTTQVASWAAGDGRPVAWIDLEPRLNEPEVLLSALASALESVTDVDCTGLANATRSPAQQATIAAPRLGEMIACSVEPFILVLDDIHVIHELAALDLIQAIVWNVPAPSTVVLVGRGELAVPLARMRAHDNLIDITRTDLALDVPAASRALRELGVELGEDEVAGIVAETEGWAVGVRLAGLAIRDAGDRSARDPAGCIDHDRTVSEYVHEEWLRGVPDDDVEFLMRLSGLDWLDGSVCDWVLGRSDSGERLERLHTSRQIVIPLGRRDSSYRMHALLRDVLDATFERVDRTGRAEIDRRVSEWFERTGDIDRSVHHALRAGDSARAQDLVCRYAAAHHTQGRYITVNRWLSAFSRDQVLGSPALCLIAAMTSLGLGDDQGATAWTRFGTAALATEPRTGTGTMVAYELAGFRAMISTGPVQDALEEAASAYRMLPPGHWHVAAGLALGALSFAAGDDDSSRRVLSETAEEARLVGAVTVEAVCRAHLAVVFNEANELAMSCSAARSARALLDLHKLEEMPTLILVTAMSALVEANDGHLDLARADVLLTRRNMAYMGAVGAWLNVQARIALARASLLLSDRVGAQVLVDEAEIAMRTQPDATRPKQQLAALREQLNRARSTLPPGPSSLTTAELRVLHYLPTNLTIDEIARRLYVSRNTVKAHAAAVYRKLGASSRSKAVVTARTAGLLPPDGDTTV